MLRSGTRHRFLLSQLLVNTYTEDPSQFINKTRKRNKWQKDRKKDIKLSICRQFDCACRKKNFLSYQTHK